MYLPFVGRHPGFPVGPQAQVPLAHSTGASSSGAQLQQDSLREAQMILIQHQIEVHRNLRIYILHLDHT